MYVARLLELLPRIVIKHGIEAKKIVIMKSFLLVNFPEKYKAVLHCMLLK
jgi:hypothetical protein